MSAERDNKAIARRVTEELWNKGNLAAADELFAPEFVNHLSAGGTGDVSAYLDEVREAREAFPDLENHDDLLVAEGDLVASYWTSRCTHRGEWKGVPATDREVTSHGMIFWRIVDGRIVERWSCLDALNLLRQIGAKVEPATGTGE